MERIETVAFDLGGVLAYQDFSSLTEEELFLFKTYMNRRKIQNRELIEYASGRIADIFLKIHYLTDGAIPTLEMLKEMKIRASIWTNNIGAIDLWFEEINLYHYIAKKDIINSFYIGCDKPNLKFYRKALEELKNMPQSVLFLDDKFQNIVGAQECGIHGRLYASCESLGATVESEIKKGRGG